MYCQFVLEILHFDRTIPTTRATIRTGPGGPDDDSCPSRGFAARAPALADSRLVGRRGTRGPGTGVNAAGGGFAPRARRGRRRGAPVSSSSTLARSRKCDSQLTCRVRSSSPTRVTRTSSRHVAFHRDMDIGHVDVRSFHCFTRPRMVREPQAQPAPSTRPPARRHTTASRATCAPAGPLLPALAGSSLRPCWGQGWLCRGQLARARSRVCASRGRVPGSYPGLGVEGLRLVGGGGLGSTVKGYKVLGCGSGRVGHGPCRAAAAVGRPAPAVVTARSTVYYVDFGLSHARAGPRPAPRRAQPQLGERRGSRATHVRRRSRSLA